MLSFTDIDTELEGLAMQSGTGLLAEIQKLSPAQMAALATALGRRHGIKVEFDQCGTAATDGNTIVLPLTSKDNSWIVRGYLDHETAHVRLTDFDQVPAGAPFRKTIWNVLEDVRIEAQMAMQYPGMRSNYRALVRELRQSAPHFFRIGDTSCPEAVIAAYISLMLRALYLKQPEVADLAIDARNVFVSVFGQDLERELLSVILKISDASTPESVVALVDEIIALLNRHIQEAPQSRPGDNAEAGEQHPEDCGSGESASGDNTEPQNGDADNPSGPDESKPDQSQSHSDPGSVKAAIQQALNSPAEIGDFGQRLIELARKKERATASPLYEIARPASANRLRLEGYLPQKIQASSGLVAELSSRLRGLLQAKKLQHATPGMSGNRIARNRLHRIRTGDPHLFLKKSPKKAVNTAVHLLIDNSTSMSESRRFFQTRESVLALIKAFEPIGGVNLGASIFPAYYPYDNLGGRHTIPVATVLDHNQRPGKTILYPGEPRGETPLGPALRYAVSVMAARQEPRKVLLILTDGEPDCTYDAGDAIQEAVGLGIEVVALGIEQLVFPDIFPHFEIVESARDLPGKMFALLEQVLLQHP